MAWIDDQGFIKTKVVLTRGGDFQYKGSELPSSLGLNNDDIYIVYRDINELGSPQTLESFNGKPLTIRHPYKGHVTAEDYKQLAIGTIYNAHIEGNNVVCDVVLQDQEAIDYLEDRENERIVSVGYSDLNIEFLDGKLYHRDIRVNHVSIVPSGRAGDECRLLDYNLINNNKINL